MKTKIAKELLKTIPLNVNDAARLTLEATEQLGSSAAGLPRTELLELLRRVLREGVQAVQRAEYTVTLQEAGMQSIAARAVRRPVTLRDLRYYVKRILCVEDFATRPLRTISTQECRELLHKAFPNSVHSYRKGRAILHSIFAYGIRREWCDTNPVHHIETPHIQEQEIEPLSAEALHRLTRTTEQPEHAPMRLSLHLMAYCGVRPAEVRRLDPVADIDWQRQCVIIRPACSKTGGGRVVPLRGAQELLQTGCPIVIPGSWERRWHELRQAAGFLTWRPDALRHTFATHHAAYFQNLPLLQLEMGHRDLTLLQTRYLNPLYSGADEAKRYWDMSAYRPTRRRKTSS